MSNRTITSIKGLRDPSKQYLHTNNVIPEGDEDLPAAFGTSYPRTKNNSNKRSPKHETYQGSKMRAIKKMKKLYGRKSNSRGGVAVNGFS